MDEKFIFQGVHMMFSGGFASEVLAGGKGKGKGRIANKDMLDEMKRGFWQKDEQRECRFVFIGKNIKQKHGERLKKDFLACAAEDPLRFAVGDMVKARVTGGWKPAKVLKTWDDGNCYRLEVQDAKKTNVWGPIDS